MVVLFFSTITVYPFLVTSGSSSIHFSEVQAHSVTFGNSVSTTNPLVLLNGTSTLEFSGGVFNGISSLSSSGAIFSDVGAATPRTIVVKINGTTFQGMGLYVV
jgi:hypothetical protein